MTRRGILVSKIVDNVYKANIGRIRSHFSQHVRVDIERVRNEKGEKMVEIWSQYPEIVGDAVKKVLGKR